MDSFQNNYSNMEERKSIFTIESDSQATITTTMEGFGSSDGTNIGNVQGSVFSPLVAPFQTYMTDNLLSMVTPQEPRAGITGANKAESVASVPGNWGESSISKTNDMFDSFGFFIKTLTSANSYVARLTREQLSVLESFRPSLLHDILRDVARICIDKRMQRALPNECAFCKNNGENEEHYSSHQLKDWRGRVQCPVLRTFHCPRCGATGERAHTIKYCPAINGGFARSGNSLRRRTSSSSFVLNDSSRVPGYSASSSPSPSTSSSLDTNMWSNFGIN